MNVYDFDKTIYDGDSTIDFYIYCLRMHPTIVCRMPSMLFGAVKYKNGKIGKEELKESFFSFLKKIENVDNDINGFWDKNQIKIKAWYKEQQKEDDIIISASPDFLLKPICERMNIHCLIASDIDKCTGRFNGWNCYGEEKVRRFKEMYDSEDVEQFYTDSTSDAPMAKLARNAYIVKKIL